jgi:hypothetical protein
MMVGKVDRRETADAVKRFCLELRGCCGESSSTERGRTQPLNRILEGAKCEESPLWALSSVAIFKHPSTSFRPRSSFVLINAETEVIAVAHANRRQPVRLAGLCLGKAKHRLCLTVTAISHLKLSVITALPWHFYFLSAWVPIPVYAIIGIGDCMHLT